MSPQPNQHDPYDPDASDPERRSRRDPRWRTSRRVRSGPWQGGPDPLAPPYDVRAAIDQIGSEVLADGTVRDALREMMRRGLDGRDGLDRLADKLRKLRATA
ncbi:hypothetical protein, partial [Staphylococcus pseudintermedius]|uniref:hypothetical protein n=1 Tax=Staphylococcus pseudintermedius TaxID=283734 RepID=UPI001C931821